MIANETILHQTREPIIKKVGYIQMATNNISLQILLILVIKFKSIQVAM